LLWYKQGAARLHHEKPQFKLMNSTPKYWSARKRRKNDGT